LRATEERQLVVTSELTDTADKLTKAQLELREVGARLAEALAERNAAKASLDETKQFLQTAQIQLRTAYTEAASKVFDEKAMALDTRIKESAELSRLRLESTLKPLAEMSCSMRPSVGRDSPTSDTIEHELRSGREWLGVTVGHAGRDTTNTVTPYRTRDTLRPLYLTVNRGLFQDVDSICKVSLGVPTVTGNSQRCRPIEIGCCSEPGDGDRLLDPVVTIDHQCLLKIVVTFFYGIWCLLNHNRIGAQVAKCDTFFICVLGGRKRVLQQLTCRLVFAHTFEVLRNHN
jgi:hypothetical protein